MKAAIFEQAGEPGDVLRLEEQKKPVAGPGEVLVRMLASPVNPSDLMTVRGVYPHKPGLPAIPGYEGVGIVEAAGSGFLGRYLKGKRVAVLNKMGGNWAEFAVIPAKQAIPLSDRLSLEQAATFFVNPATAYVMTRKVLQIPRDAWLLQTAAGSVLGGMVRRLGRHYGFKVINVVRREEQAEELKASGADAILVFNGDEHEIPYLREQLEQVASTSGVKYAIDPVGGQTTTAVMDVLAVDGHLLLFGSLSSDPIVFFPRALITPAAKVAGFWLGHWMDQQSLLSKLALVKQITKLIRQGILESEIAAQFPLNQIKEAVIAAEQTGRSGKALLTMQQEK